MIIGRECRAAEEIAAEASVPVFTAVRLADHPSRDAWDVAITAATAATSPVVDLCGSYGEPPGSFHDSTGAPVPTRRCAGLPGAVSLTRLAYG